MEKFYSPTGKIFNCETLLQEIFFYIKSDPLSKYKVIIGTDSANHETTDFVSAIVVYRVGHGGRFFWKKVNHKKYRSLRERIYQEALLSLELAEKILKGLSKEKDIDFDFEIHMDIGSQGPTKEMLQEVIGMIRGSGYKVRTKPDSYGATKVADRYT